MIDLIVLSVLAGILGRMGGDKRFHTTFRDSGVPTCMILYMTLTGHFHWSLILCYGAMYGVCTTYFKKKGTDSKWYNWLFVGLGFSVCMLPYVYFTHDWLGFAIRSAVCTAAIVAWCLAIGWDVLEEFGRYFIVIATLRLLFIGA